MNGSKLFVLSREKLDDGDVRAILWEVEGEDRPEWKDIADCSPAYMSYRTRWNCLEVRNGVLLRLSQSLDRQSKQEWFCR
jgi:hypothetical protein